MAIIEAEVTTMQVAPGFDYGLIDEGIRDEVKAAARSIHQLSAGVMTGIVAIGKRLIEVKGMIPHGQFVDWIVGEFQIEPRMAQNYMNVAREYGDPQKRNIISLFSPTVAYLLSAPSTPEAARVEVEQAALSGQKVTVELAKKAAATFAEPKPAKPQPIAYAKVHTLETCVRQWLSIAIGEGGTPDPDSVLDMLKIQSGEPDKAGNWLSLVCQSLVEAEIVWRKSDLTQAINNVRDQRRQAKLQAASKKVYVEPKAERLANGRSRHEHVLGNLVTVPSHDGNFLGALKDATAEELIEALERIPVEGNKTKREKIEARLRKLEREDPTVMEPSIEDLEQEADDLAAMALDELEAVALVAAEQAEEDAERAARAATRPSFENVPDPETVKRPGILTRDWVIFVLSNYTPNSTDFATALKAATPDDLREAMASLDTEEKHHVARCKALKDRFDELMAPDPRIARSREGMELIAAGRAWVRDNYLELTGLEVGTLAYWRDTSEMLGKLESLVDILTRKEVRE